MDSTDQVVPKARFDALAIKTKELLAANQALKAERDSIRLDAAKLAAALKAKNVTQDNSALTPASIHLPAPGAGGFNFVEGVSMSPSLAPSSTPSVSPFSWITSTPTASTEVEVSTTSPSPLPSPAPPTTIESSSRLAQELKKANGTIKQLQQELASFEASQADLRQECTRLSNRCIEVEQEKAQLQTTAKHWEQDAQSKVWEATAKMDLSGAHHERERALIKELGESHQQALFNKIQHEKLQTSLEAALQTTANAQAETESLRRQLADRDLQLSAATVQISKRDSQTEAHEAELRLLSQQQQQSNSNATSLPKVEGESVIVELKSKLKLVQEELEHSKRDVEKYENALKSASEENKRNEEIQLSTAKRKEDEFLKEINNLKETLSAISANETTTNRFEETIQEMKLQVEHLREELSQKDNRIQEMTVQYDQFKVEENERSEKSIAEFKANLSQLEERCKEEEMKRIEAEKRNEQTIEVRGKQQQEISKQTEELINEKDQIQHQFSLFKEEIKQKEQENARTREENESKERVHLQTIGKLEEEIRILIEREKTREEQERMRQKEEEEQRKQLKGEENFEIEKLTKEIEKERERLLAELSELQKQLKKREEDYKEQEIERQKVTLLLEQKITDQQQENEKLDNVLRQQKEEFNRQKELWEREQNEKEIERQIRETNERQKFKEEQDNLIREINEKQEEKETKWKDERNQDIGQQKETQEKLIQDMKEKYELTISELKEKISNLTLSFKQEQEARQQQEEQRKIDEETAKKQAAVTLEEETQRRIKQLNEQEQAVASLKAEKEEISNQLRTVIERVVSESAAREENERALNGLRETASSTQKVLEARENELRDIVSTHMNCDTRLHATIAQHAIAIEVAERQVADLKRQLEDAQTQATRLQSAVEEATGKEIKLACVVANLEQSLVHQTKAAEKKQEELSDALALMEMELETLRKQETEREAQSRKSVELEQQLTSAQATCTQHVTQLAALTTKIEELEGVVKNRADEISNLTQIREGQEGEIVKYKTQVEELNQTISSMRAQIDSGTTRSQHLANIEQVNQELTEQLQTLQTERLKREEDYRNQLKLKQDQLAEVTSGHEEQLRVAASEAAAALAEKQRIADEWLKEQEAVRNKDKELTEQVKQVQELKQLLRQVEVKLRDKIAVLAEKETESKTQAEQFAASQLALLETKRLLSERETEIAHSNVKCSELLSVVDSKEQLTNETNAKLQTQTKETDELKGQLEHFKQQVLKKHNKWKKLEETLTANYNELLAKHEATLSDITRLQESIRVLTLEGKKKDQNISDQTDAILKLCATEHDLRNKLGEAAKREQAMVAAMTKTLQK